jgi:hypothetical protein
VDPRAGLDDLEKILDPTGTRNSDPSVVQSIASRYTDYATLRDKTKGPREVGNICTKGIKERKKEIILSILLDGSYACCDIT